MSKQIERDLVVLETLAVRAVEIATRVAMGNAIGPVASGIIQVLGMAYVADRSRYQRDTPPGDPTVPPGT